MDEKYAGLWVFVTADNKRYLGRVVEYGPFEDLDEDDDPVTIFEKVDEEEPGDVNIVNAGTLVLSPALDFISIEIPTQDPTTGSIGIQTQPFVKLYDYTGSPETRLYVCPTTVMFIDELPEDSQKIYKEFISRGLTAGLKTQKKPLIEVVPPGTALAPHARR